MEFTIDVHQAIVGVAISTDLCTCPPGATCLARRAAKAGDATTFPGVDGDDGGEEDDDEELSEADPSLGAAEKECVLLLREVNVYLLRL